MRRFIIRRLEDKGSTVLAMFNDRKTALEEGRKIYDGISGKCMLDCIEADVDHQGNVNTGRYLLFQVWD